MYSEKSPDVTLVFSGLFLFAFEKENKFCQLVVAQAERHCLKINIKTQSDSPHAAPELSINVPDGDIFFGVTRKLGVIPRAQGVDTYEPGPFGRNSQHDRRDFRWLLDFEGRELHNRRLPLRADALKRSVFVNNGLFYTHNLEGVAIQPPPSPSPLTAGTTGGSVYALRSYDTVIAESIGCDIYLDGGEKFQIRYGPRADYSIDLGKEPKTNYEIWVTNLCAYQPGSESAHGSDVTHYTGGSDVDLYYDIINVPENEQFRISSSIPSVNDSHPCNPAGLLTSEAPLQGESMTE